VSSPAQKSRINEPLGASTDCQIDQTYGLSKLSCSPEQDPAPYSLDSSLDRSLDVTPARFNSVRLYDRKVNIIQKTKPQEMAGSFVH